MTGPELDRRIGLTGLTIKQFAAAAGIPVGTLYGYRRGHNAMSPTVTAHLHTVLEQLERAHLAELLGRYPLPELLAMYPQKEITGDASPRG